MPARVCREHEQSEGSEQLSQREPELNISEADIRGVYREGEEAVVALFKRLIERIEKTEERLGQ